MGSKVKYLIIIFFVLFSSNLFSQVPINIDRAIQNSVDRLYSTISNNKRLFFYDIQSDSYSLGNYTTDNLISITVNDKRHIETRLIILERNAQIMEIMNDEMYYQYSGFVSDETAVSLGRRIGAEIIVIGNINPSGNNFRLHIRVIDIETAQILSVINENIRNDKQLRSLISQDETRITSRETSSFSLYNRDWVRNNLYIGARLGFSPSIYTLNSNIDMKSENHISFNPALQFGVRITNHLLLQTEIMYSSDEVSPKGNDSILLKADTLTIPLILKVNFMRSIFNYSFFGGLYYPIPLGKLNVTHTNNSGEYDYTNPFGFLLGFDFGWKAGPGIIFADIRFLQDAGYLNANGSDQYMRSNFVFSVGYNFPLWGKR